MSPLMTFDQWRALGKRVDSLDAESGFELNAGREYPAGFVIILPGWYMVPVPQDQAFFDSLDAAERFLWEEWCDGEVNAGGAP